MQTQSTDIHIIFKKFEDHINTGHYKADTLAESIDLYIDGQTAS